MAGEHSPTLRASLLDVEQAKQSIVAEEGSYPLVLQLDGGYTHSKSPRFSTSIDENTGDTVADVSTTVSKTMTLGSELRQVFPWGTSVGFRLEGSWTKSSSPAIIGSARTTIGPGWGLTGRLTVAQPLLRGAGTDVGEAELRAAEFNRSAAEQARDRVGSELLRDVLLAYWDLWYASETVRIEQAARDLAERERRDTEQRIEAGALAPVEIHPFTTRVAQLDEALLAARLERERRALELGERVGRAGAQSRGLVAASATPPEPSAPPQLPQLVERALRQSPELKELDTQIAASRDREEIAGEQERHRLDVQGWVQAEGLGNREVPPALEQYFTFGAVSAHVGLIYEAPLTGSRRVAQRAGAKLATDAAIERREAVRQRIESSATLQHAQLLAARRRVRLAARTVEVASAQLAAAKDKYKAGDGLVIEIQQAEDAMRQARLRVARARVDWVQARLVVDYLTGAMLARHSSALSGAAAARRHKQRRMALRTRQPSGPF